MIANSLHSCCLNPSYLFCYISSCCKSLTTAKVKKVAGYLFSGSLLGLIFGSCFAGITWLTSSDTNSLITRFVLPPIIPCALLGLKYGEKNPGPIKTLFDFFVVATAGIVGAYALSGRWDFQLDVNLPIC